MTIFGTTVQSIWAPDSATYKATVTDYIERVQIGKYKNVTAEEARSCLLNDFEDWHDRAIATIRNSEIERRLELIRDGDEKHGLKPRPYMANLIYARLNAFFEWCARPNGKLATTPMLGIEKPNQNTQRRERDWFKGTAADEAIRKIWAAAD